MDVVASISDRVGDLGEYLREQREGARLSVRQLATLAGVSNPYLSQVERGLRKPSAEVLQQIAKGLRISAEVLYIRAGILDHEGRQDVEAAVYADPFLNDRQRRVLLDIYASFRAENERNEPASSASTAAVQDDASHVSVVGDGEPSTAKPFAVRGTTPARVARTRVAKRSSAAAPAQPAPSTSTGSPEHDAADDVDAAQPAAAPAKRVARKRSRSS